jgi:hypothetical protein
MKITGRPTHINTVALEATLALHKQLLEDDGFCGYYGTLNQIGGLLDEVQSLAVDALALYIGDITVDSLIDQWYVKYTNVGT